MVARRSQSYEKGAARRQSGAVPDGRKVLTADDIWTDPQRKLFTIINWARDQIDEAEKVKAERVDFYAYKILQLLETGMTKARVGRIFHIAPATVGDLEERGRTVRAVMEKERANGVQG